MSNVIHRDNYRIDEYSQRILSTLTDGDKTVAQLRDESGLAEWESADYRLREHLIPGGWVEKVGESPKTMSLTPDGQELIENEGFDAPTVTDVRETALEASETAQSARESADRFRKQLYDLRDRLDRHNERIADLANAHNSQVDRLNDLEQRTDQRAGDTQDALNDHRHQIQHLTERVEELEQQHEQETLFEKLWPF